MAANRTPTSLSGHVEHALLDRKDEILAQSTDESKLLHAAEALQKLRDRPYESQTYVVQPKFQIGDEVVVLSMYYYFARITEIDLKYVCPQLHKIVPAYKVEYRGWTEYELGREWVAEYDVLALNGPLCRPIELWLSHHWNVCQRCRWSRLPKDKKKGIFFLEKEHYAKIAMEVDEQFRKSFFIDDPQMTVQKFLDLS